MKNLGSFLLGIFIAASSLVLGQVPISGLPPAVTPFNGTEVIVLTQKTANCSLPNGCTRQAPVSAFSPVTAVPVLASQGGTGETGTITGIPKTNGLSAFTAATSSDVAGLFSGCSSSLPALSFNGTCVSGAGVSIGKAMTSAYTASISNPTTMTWAPIWQRREVSPFAPAMQQSFDPMVQDAGLYTRSGNINTWSFSNGLLSISSTAATPGNGQTVINQAQGFNSAEIAVSLENVVITPDGTSSSFNNLAIGITDNAVANQLDCYFEVGNSGSSNRVNIAQVSSGAFTLLAQSAVGTFTAALGFTGLACTIDNGGITAFVKLGNTNSWYPILTASTSQGFNLQVPATLANFHPFMSATGGVTTPWKVGGWRVGSPGYLTFRDWKIVSNYDGTPYISNGFMYFTSDDSLTSVYSMNIASGALEKVGKLTFFYSGQNQLDQNAKIVWDPTLGLWRVLWASWHAGLNNGVKLYYATYSGDILYGSKVVSGGVQIPVTQATNNAVYDEDIVFNGTNWDITYAVSPGGAFNGNFYIVHDQTSNFTSFTNVWAASGTTGFEGSAIAKIGGNFYVAAGNGSQFDVWNMSSATPLGTLNVSPFPSPSGNPPPHFVIFPWMDAGITSYYALTWNNTHAFIGGVDQGLFSGGTLMLYKAAQTETGFELPALGVR